MAELTYSVAETAKVLGVSPDTIYAAVAQNKIPYVRLSLKGRILIPKDALREWLLEAKEQIKPVETSKPKQVLITPDIDVAPRSGYWKTVPGCGGRKRKQ